MNNEVNNNLNGESGTNNPVNYIVKSMEPNNQSVVENQPINPKFHPEPKPQTTYEYEENNAIEPEKKKKSFVPLIIIILLLVLAVGGYFGYNYFFAKPYKQALDGLFSKVKSSYLLNGKYKVTSNIKLSTDNEEYSFLDGISIATESSIDPSTKKSYVSIDYSEDNNKLLNAVGYIDNNKLYVSSKDLFDKTIYYDISEVMNNKINIDSEDMEYLIDVLHRMLVASLKDEKPIKSKVTANINDKEVNLTENKYVINSSNSTRINNNLYDVLINDSKAISIISKYSGESESEIKEELNGMKDILKENANEQVDNSDGVGLIIYTKGLFNTFCGIGMTSSDEKLFDYYIIDDYSKFVVDSEYLKFNIEGKDNQTIILKADNQELLSGNINKKADNDYSINLNISKLLTLNMDYKLESITSMPSANTTNVVDVKELTEQDEQKIMENFSKTMNSSKVYQYYNNLTSSAMKNAFKTEIKDIYKNAQQQWIIDSMTSTKTISYYRINGKSGAVSSSEVLELYGREEIDYYITVNKSGKITKFYVTDGTYQYYYEGGDLRFEYIGSSELGENAITKMSDVSGKNFVCIGKKNKEVIATHKADSSKSCSK